jgi:hypothetical protein
MGRDAVRGGPEKPLIARGLEQIALFHEAVVLLANDGWSRALGWLHKQFGELRRRVDHRKVSGGRSQRCAILCCKKAANRNEDGRLSPSLPYRVIGESRENLGLKAP